MRSHSTTASRRACARLAQLDRMKRLEPPLVRAKGPIAAQLRQCADTATWLVPALLPVASGNP